MVKLEPEIQEKLDAIASGVIAAHAEQVDREGAFPRASIDALRAAGLLGLISSRDAGGLGQGPGPPRSPWSGSLGSAAPRPWYRDALRGDRGPGEIRHGSGAPRCRGRGGT
jgi:hypothetical protein